MSNALALLRSAPYSTRDIKRKRFESAGIPQKCVRTVSVKNVGLEGDLIFLPVDTVGTDSDNFVEES